MNRIKERLKSPFRVKVVSENEINDNIIYVLEKQYPDIYNDILRNLEGDVSGDVQNILLMQEVIKFLEDGKKIGAIKYIRSETGMGLKDAKDYVELYEGSIVKTYNQDYTKATKKLISEDALKILESYQKDFPEYFI